MKRRAIGLVVDRSCGRQGSVLQLTLLLNATDNRVQSPQMSPPRIGLDERVVWDAAAKSKINQ